MIRLKSVVPPPTSHTSTRSPTYATAPAVALALEPCVEGGLRFFEQRDVLIPGLFGCAPSEFPRLLVKRSRHGQEDVLFPKGTSLCFPDTLASHALDKCAGTAKMHRPAKAWEPPRAPATAGSARFGSLRHMTAKTWQKLPGVGTLGAAFARQFSNDKLRLGLPWQ